MNKFQLEYVVKLYKEELKKQAAPLEASLNAKAEAAVKELVGKTPLLQKMRTLALSASRDKGTIKELEKGIHVTMSKMAQTCAQIEDEKLHDFVDNVGYSDYNASSVWDDLVQQLVRYVTKEFLKKESEVAALKKLEEIEATVESKVMLAGNRSALIKIVAVLNDMTGLKLEV